MQVCIPVFSFNRVSIETFTGVTFMHLKGGILRDVKIVQTDCFPLLLLLHHVWQAHYCSLHSMIPLPNSKGCLFTPYSLGSLPICLLSVTRVGEEGTELWISAYRHTPHVHMWLDTGIYTEIHMPVVHATGSGMAEFQPLSLNFGMVFFNPFSPSLNPLSPNQEGHSPYHQLSRLDRHKGCNRGYFPGSKVY